MTLVEQLRDVGRPWQDETAALCDEAADRIEALEAALRSIAANTCCDRCQEAALVARAAITAVLEQKPAADPDQS
jgi:hypothetical protein